MLFEAFNLSDINCCKVGRHFSVTGFTPELNRHSLIYSGGHSDEGIQLLS